MSGHWIICDTWDIRLCLEKQNIVHTEHLECERSGPRAWPRSHHQRFGERKQWDTGEASWGRLRQPLWTGSHEVRQGSDPYPAVTDLHETSNILWSPTSRWGKRTPGRWPMDLQVLLSPQYHFPFNKYSPWSPHTESAGALQNGRSEVWLSWEGTEHNHWECPGPCHSEILENRARKITERQYKSDEQLHGNLDSCCGKHQLSLSFWEVTSEAWVILPDEST